MAADILNLARKLPREEFVERFAGLHLVFSLDPQEMPVGGFETFVGRQTERGSPARKRLQVLRIEKAPGNPYAERISVGRTGNCDLVIRDPSVSKLHAYFGQDETGRLVIVDQHSSNGTMINGNVAHPGASELVESGDLLQFGDIRAQVLDAGAVYDTVQREL